MAYKWPFGKFKDKDLTQIPSWYMKWVLKEAKKNSEYTGFTQSMCRVVRTEIKRRRNVSNQ